MSQTQTPVEDVIRRVETIIRNGGLVTLGQLAPELTASLGEELAQTPVGKLFGLELLAKAPATWLNEPPLPVERISAESTAALVNFATRSVRELECFFAIRMLLNEGAMTLLASGVDAMRGADAELARARILSVLSLPAEKILPAGAVPGAIFSTSAVFEEQIHAWAQAIRTITECWYAPLLMAAVDVSRIARCEEPLAWAELVQIGDVMATARKEWPHNDARRRLLNDPVHKVRNADAHCKVDIDVVGETVKFTTVSRERKVTLGPLTKDAVAKIGGELLETCMAMKAAFETLLRPGFADTAHAEGLFVTLMRVVINPLREANGQPPLAISPESTR